MVESRLVTSSGSSGQKWRRVQRWTTCASAFGAAAVLWPIAADAATVSVRASADVSTGIPGTAVAFVAAAGERNHVVVHAAFVSSPWTVTDSGAPLTAGAGCSAVDPHTVHCLVPATLIGVEPQFADVQLGDRDDEATIVEPDLNGGSPLYAYGGDGNDVLSVPDPGGELHGGPGDDRLSSSTTTYYRAILDGGGGHDELRGGAGDDTLTDGDLDNASAGSALVPDVIAGGLGVDTVTYARRTAAVSADLAAGRAGARGEGDVLSGIENLVGSDYDDRLAGDGTSNLIDGQGGRDILIGRAGDDRFANGAGPISCGRGNDVISRPSSRDDLGRGCERISRDIDIDPDDYPAYPRVTRTGSLQYVIHCFNDSELGGIQRCSGRVTLREARGEHRRLGVGRFPPGRWTNRSVRVVLTPLGRRLASRRLGVRATVRLTIDSVIRWTIRLKVPRATRGAG
jgi:hypothetical protein